MQTPTSETGSSATPANAAQNKRRTWTLRMPMMVGIVSVVFMGGAMGLWGTTTQIAGAVLGKGSVGAADVATAVQHPVGGVVAQVMARGGDKVRAGDVILRLDDRDLRAALEATETLLFETLAGQARLEAVVDEAPALTPHPLLVQAAAQRPDIATLMDRQRRELDAHYEALANQERLLGRQMDQVREQITGIEAQLAAKTAQAALLAEELEKSEALAAKGLIKRKEHFDQNRAALDIQGETGRLRARAAELRGRIAELELKRLGLAPDLRAKASDKLARLRTERAKHMEKRQKLISDLNQLEVRAPVSGTVHDSKVEGLRSVVVKAKTILSIVPETTQKVMKVKIAATDIDQVFVGQEAALRFAAFSRRSTPVIYGDVSQVSPDVFLDPKTRKPYYDVEILLREGEQARLEGKPLIPGMPVDAFISTSPRTPLNYVTKPLMDYLDRAFRDA